MCYGQVAKIIKLGGSDVKHRIEEMCSIDLEISRENEEAENELLRREFEYFEKQRKGGASCNA